MSVKRSHSASRVLAVLEAIANHQPIGIRALGRLLNEDKSAVQRAIMTLAGDGWIRPSSKASAGWEVTAHILAVAHAAHGGNDLRRRARPLLERLRDETEETVLLIVPDVKSFVIADVVESRQVLRMVPHVGTLVTARNTASGRAMLPFFDAARQAALLGEQPDREMLERYAATRKQHYAVSVGEINSGATNVAAPIFGLDGLPVGAVVITAPRERLGISRHRKVGEMTARTARELSQNNEPSSRREP